MKDMYMISYYWKERADQDHWGYFYFGEGKEWADITLKWLLTFRLTIRSIKTFKEKV